MANSHAKLLVVAVTLAVLLIGSAEATKKCPKWHKDCNPRKPGCETCVEKDVNNCGDCGRKCKTLPYTWTWCAGGQCRYKCKDGFCNCDNNLWSNGCETRTSDDPKNCGFCGKKCKAVPYAAASKCVKGKCSEPVCNVGRGNCDKNIWSNGCEVDLATDVNNCGICGKKCTVTLVGYEPYCRNREGGGSECAKRCTAGYRYDELSDGCIPDTAPPPPAMMSPPPPPSDLCGGADLLTDIMNCGECDWKCYDFMNGIIDCRNGVCINECGPGSHYNEFTGFCDADVNPAPPPPSDFGALSTGGV